MDRREFLAVLAAAAAAPASAFAAALPGIPASPQLLDAFRSVRGIEEGSGAGTLHILFAPWCHVSPMMYRYSRAYLSQIRLRWIPFSGGQPEGSEGTERLLASGTASAVQQSFVPLQPLAVQPATPLADAQDAAVAARIEPLVLRDSGRGIVTPTLAYGIGDGRARLVRGGLHQEDFATIGRVAS